MAYNTGVKKVVFSKEACERLGIISGQRLSNNRRVKNLSVYADMNTNATYCLYNGCKVYTERKGLNIHWVI